MKRNSKSLSPCPRTQQEVEMKYSSSSGRGIKYNIIRHTPLTMTVAVAAGSFKAWGTMKISTVCVMTMATSWPLRAMAMVIMGIAFWHRIISTRLTQAISIRRACACCKKMRVDINLLHLIITYYKNIRILDAIICWLSLLTLGMTKTATIAKQTDFFGGSK